MNTQNTKPAQVGHTPTPWQRMLAYEAKDKQPPYNVWTIIGNTDADERKQSVVATTITDDGDASFIVRACNAHEELVCACKAALQCQLDGLDENTVDALETAISRAEGRL